MFYLIQKTQLNSNFNIIVLYIFETYKYENYSLYYDNNIYIMDLNL